MSDAPNLPAAALQYADELGWYVFPLVDGGKVPRAGSRWRDESTRDAEQIKKWWTAFPRANIGVDCGKSLLDVLDVDPRNGGDASFEALRHEHGKATFDTVTQSTPSGGTHYVYNANGAMIRNTQSKIAPGIDTRGDGGYFVAAPSIRADGSYLWEIDEGPFDRVAAPWPKELTAAIPTESPKTRADDAVVIPEGKRNGALASLAGSMRNRGMGEDAIAAALLKENEAKCKPPLPESEVHAIAHSVSRYDPKAPVTERQHVRDGDEPEWDDVTPVPVLGADARYGLAGDILAALEEQTEAHPAAILFTLLAGVGNAAGPGVFASVGSEHHPARLSVLVVADTGTGKGQSLAIVRPILAGANSDWWDRAYCSGFNSGEGLIARLSGAHDGEGVAPETRALIIEPEFVRVLGVNTRDGSTLSAIARQAWDSGRLQITVKKESLLVDGAHVSLIGHITPPELRAKLIGSDLSNGFANRLLFVHAHRARKLPSGGYVEAATFGCFAKLVSEALQVGPRELRRTPSADKLWDELYYTEPEPGGLLGAVTGRSAAQRLRLAVAYAILDKARELRPEHIRAAEAAWRYCYDSAHHIFGSALADATEARILDALRDAWPNGIDGTGLRGLFAGHKTSAAINTACETLEARGLVRSERVPTEGRSRIVRYARAKSSESAESTAAPSLSALTTLTAQVSRVVEPCRFPVGTAGETCQRCARSWAAHAADATGKPEGAI